jgi:hypothetical protein
MKAKPTKKKKKVSERGLSDSNLLKMRREVVNKLFGNCCFFCGLPKGQVEIEDHHIVKRKMFLLRYDWRNGIPVCKFGCHQNAENPWGKHKIDEYLVKNDLLLYLQERSGNCKNFLIKIGMTKTDYKRFMYEDLKAKLKDLELGDYDNLPF